MVEIRNTTACTCSSLRREECVHFFCTHTIENVLQNCTIFRIILVYYNFNEYRFLVDCYYCFMYIIVGFCSNGLTQILSILINKFGSFVLWIPPVRARSSCSGGHTGDRAQLRTGRRNVRRIRFLRPSRQITTSRRNNVGGVGGVRSPRVAGASRVARRTDNGNYFVVTSLVLEIATSS